MRYHLLAELNRLVETKMVTARKHPTLPLTIYNYSPTAMSLPPAQWSDAMMDARGLILDYEGEIVGRGFRKFWNYEQVIDQIPADPGFDILEKMDGSLGIVCSYNGQTVVATRGSFESDQAKWASQRFNFTPSPGQSFLFELIYPENRIVVDYADRQATVLLAVLNETGDIIPGWERAGGAWWEAGRYVGGLWPVVPLHMRTWSQFYVGDPHMRIKDLMNVRGFDTSNKEGYVLRWKNGFQCKVKFEEYKRLHRLITQCSTRMIWELLRSGKGIAELLDRVPAEFSSWVRTQGFKIHDEYDRIWIAAKMAFANAPRDAPVGTLGSERRAARKAFAEYAMKQPNWSLLFSQLDGKLIDDDVWKLVEPKWATPFMKEPE